MNPTQDQLSQTAAEVEQAIIDMLRESLRAGKVASLELRSGSMAPILPLGATIEIEACSRESLQPGEVITMIARSEAPTLLTHRYWGQERDSQELLLLTQGDRAAAFDPPAAADALLGRVAACKWRRRRLDLAAGPGKWLNVRLAWLAVVERRWLHGLTPNAQGGYTLAQVRQTREWPPAKYQILTVRLGRRLVRLVAEGLALAATMAVTAWPRR